MLQTLINTYSSFFYIVYFVLSYYLLYSSSGLSTDVFHIKTNIHTLEIVLSMLTAVAVVIRYSTWVLLLPYPLKHNYHSIVVVLIHT